MKNKLADLWVYSVDFTRAPLEVRSQLTSKLEDFVDLLAPEAAEKAFLTTCNRVEVYGVGRENLIEAWAKASQLSAETLKSAVARAENEEALKHLFRVSASLESMVVGETQITGQVKKAYEAACARGTVGPVLHRAFQVALKTSKRIRSQTDVGRLQVSIPSIGVKLAEKVLGSLSSKVIGIIGLGEMGRLSAEHFASVQPRQILLYNRTQSTADEIARNLVAEGVSGVEVVSSIEEVLKRSHAVVSAVDSLWMSRDQLLEHDAAGQIKFLLDMAVPASIESSEDLQNLYFFSIDDLSRIAEENSKLRVNELDRAESFVSEAAHDLWTQITEVMGTQHTFQKLKEKLHGMTLEELAMLKPRLSGLSEKDWKEIEKMAHRLEDRYLQDPMMEIKAQSSQLSKETSETFTQMVRNLFKI